MAAAFVVELQAQNTKQEDVTYTYIKLPLTPLPATVTHYQSFVVPAYEAENKRKQAEYDAEMALAEAEYQKEMQEYPAKVKAAEDKYAAEMEEWKKKPLIDKVVEKEILEENNKPVKQLPPVPYRRSVQPPALQTVYDYAAVANTYFILDGYPKGPENAVKIEVTLYGFDYTRPQQLSQQKKVVSSSGGTTTTQTVTYYHVEFTYRHTMSVKVTAPDGKELFFITPQELNVYKTYKSPESTGGVAINEESLAKTHEEKIFRENLLFINELVNDRFGFKRETRKTELGYVKAKDDTYADLLLAYNEARAGLNLLVDDETAATEKLQKAAGLWNTALQESDPANKKARIDKDVTTLIYFNLLETCFALRDVAGAEKAFTGLNTLSLSNREMKHKEEYEKLFNDLKKRLQANKK